MMLYCWRNALFFFCLVCALGQDDNRCSDGIVVLLDSAWEQPPSVRKEDLGKAIALHVAGTTLLREHVNLAMHLNLDDSCLRFCRPSFLPGHVM